MQAPTVSADLTEPAPPGQRHNIWLHAICLAAFLPFIQALVTWDYDGRMTDGWFALRHFSFPAILGEIFIIIIAARQGMMPGKYIAALTKPAKILMLLWAGLAIISSMIVTDNRVSSILTLARFMLHGLFFVSLLHLIMQAAAFSVLKWLKIICAGISAYVGILIIFALTVPDSANFPWMLRMPSATNIRQIANIIAIPAMAPIAIMLFGKGERKWLYALIIFLLTAFIAWSGSRGALFGITGAAIGALLLLRRLPNIRSLAATVLAFATGLLSSLALPLPTGSFGLFRFADKLQTPGQVTSGRMEIWIDTFSEILKSPWIGHGSGRFNANMHQLYGIDFNHPHNFILQFAYDWGIIGALAFLVLLAIFAIEIIRKASQNRLAGFAGLAGFIALLLIGLVDGAFFYPLTIMMAIAILAPLFANPHIGLINKDEYQK